MKYLDKILLGIFVLSLFSCGDKFALNEQTLYIQDVNRGWITDDTLGCEFIMTDNNGISQSFSNAVNMYDFNYSGSKFLIITTNITHREYYYKEYFSSFGTSFSFSLEAAFEPFGDEFCAYIGGNGFHYDFKHRLISCIDTGFGIKRKIRTEDGYEAGEEEILSDVTILDSYATNYNTYNDVLFFQLKDYEDKWGEFTVVSMYIAKDIGLIKYERNNGIICERR